MSREETLERVVRVFDDFPVDVERSNDSTVVVRVPLLGPGSWLAGLRNQRDDVEVIIRVEEGMLTVTAMVLPTPSLTVVPGTLWSDLLGSVRDWLYPRLTLDASESLTVRAGVPEGALSDLIIPGLVADVACAAATVRVHLGVQEEREIVVPLPSLDVFPSAEAALARLQDTLSALGWLSLPINDMSLFAIMPAEPDDLDDTFGFFLGSEEGIRLVLPVVRVSRVATDQWVRLVHAQELGPGRVTVTATDVGLDMGVPFIDASVLKWSMSALAAHKGHLFPLLGLRPEDADVARQYAAQVYPVLAALRYRAFEEGGGEAALNDAVALGEAALALLPPHDADLPKRLGELAARHHSRYQRTGNLEDLDRAITLTSRAIEVPAQDRTTLSANLSNLGGYLGTRHAVLHNPLDLEHGIQLLERALSIADSVGDLSRDRDHRPTILSNLSSQYVKQYERSGDITNIHHAIGFANRALRLLEANAPQDLLVTMPATCWGTLSLALHVRYDHLGDRHDLDEAIGAVERALALMDAQPAHQSPRYVYINLLNYLSLHVMERYKLDGSMADLEHAIAVSQQAIDIVEAGHDDQGLGALLPMLLTNMINYRLARYNRLGDDRDLLDALRQAEHAFHLMPATSAYQARLLANWASALYDNYLRLGDVTDLDRAVELCEQSIALAPAGSRGDTVWPDLPLLLGNLGIYLAARYTRTQHVQDLDRAIEVQLRAVTLLRALGPGNSHVALPANLSNLTNRYWTRYSALQHGEDLARAIETGQEAVDLTQRHGGDQHPDLPRRLNILANCLNSWFHRDPLSNERDLDAAIRMTRMAVTLAGPTNAQTPLYLNNLAVSLFQRYRHFGASRDLDEAIRSAQLAVRLTLHAGVQGIPPVTLVQYRTGLAWLLMERDGAWDWPAAELQLTRALQQHEAVLGRQSGEQSASEYLRERQSLYPLAVRCRVELGKRYAVRGNMKRAGHYWTRAWQAAEEGKGRLFAALLTADRTALAARDPTVAELEARIEQLSSEINRLLTLASPDDTDGMSDAPTSGRGSRLARLWGDYNAVVDELRRVDPELASMTAVSPRAAAEIQDCLRDQGLALLEFYPLPDALVVFLLDGSSVHITLLPITRRTMEATTDELDRLVRSGRAHLDVSAHMRSLFDEVDLSSLWHMLDTLTPSRSAGRIELCIVPTGPLHVWPLHLLPYHEGILWDAFAISYAPSADALFYCCERVPRDHAPHVLLAPSRDLPGTLLEATIAEKTGWTVARLGAALPTVLQAYPGDFALASHVFSDQSRRGDVNQVLFGRGPVSALELLRILRGRPPAEQGMLGSCSAHYEVAMEGDTLTGLTRSLLAAGLRSLTTSLWDLDDLVAAYMGCRFRDLVYGDRWPSKAAALRAAALELRDGGWPVIERWLVEQVAVLGGEEQALAYGLLAACHLNQGNTEGYLLAWAAYERMLAATPPGQLRVVLEGLTKRYGQIVEWMRKNPEGLSARALGACIRSLVQQASRPLDASLYGSMILIGAPLVADTARHSVAEPA